MKPVVRGGVVLVGFAVLGGCGEGPSERIEALRDQARKPTPAQIERIAGALDDPDRDVRATSLVLMADLDPERAHAMALRGLDDRDGFVRAAAVRIAASRADPALVGKLLALAPDAVWQVRAAVLEALATTDAEGVPAVFERGVTDPVPHVRRAALQAAFARPRLVGTATLASALRGDEDWENRVLAARALGVSADPEAYAVLDEASADGNEFVRAAAVRERGTLARAGVPRPTPPPATPPPEVPKRPPGV